MPLPLVITANAAVGKRWASLAIGLLGGLVAGATFLLGALDFAGAPILATGLTQQQRYGLDIGTMATGFVAAALVSQPVRARLARIIPIDPENPVHALALVLAMILFGTQIVTIAFTDVLAADQKQPPLTLTDLIVQEVPFLILAGAGVGIFMRRQLSVAVARLGLVRPAWWHLGLALAAAGIFFAFSQGMDYLSQALTPDLARRVQTVTDHVFGQLNNPVGIAALALVPGICEEILFRGALQPRIGLVATALLFTSIHTEYGFSVAALAIFVIALGLGLVRKYTNTTSSVLTHATYNLLAGFGIGGSYLAVAAVIEVALVGIAAYGIWRSRRAVANPAGSQQPG
jgi:membrane protease YdiL (CAAX protease family)